jgi:predicted membrane-bound spermidine synthase
MNQPVSRVAPLLFFSGACALIYQVAWFRELRLIFGASTAASAAVLAIFMGGLGVGGAILGRRADKSKAPLGLYANLELLVAVAAGVSPALVFIARSAYLGVGGSAALGSTGATIVRLLLSIVVLGPATFVMGGTLPAAARAVGTHADTGRKNVAALYGVNTMGAVLGAVAANFLLLEVFGTRLTLFLACLVNALVGLVGRMLSRDAVEEKASSEEKERTSDSGASPVAATPIPSWLPPGAAAIAGFSFMLMELVWYRMLAPILGGSSYTFGLILAVALVGIGIGGLIYATGRIPATARSFAFTCALEALFVAIPYGLGDRLALLSLGLRPLATLGFGMSVATWSVVASIAVLPAAIVSGAQFPLIIGLYGSGAKSLGREVGLAYLANTIGAIVGALAGGFGLLPALSALGCWRLIVFMLVGASIVSLFASRPNRSTLVRTGVVTAVAFFALMLNAQHGPSALWRHRGIGAGRLDSAVAKLSPFEIDLLERESNLGLAWEQDGVESALAVNRADGFTFVVNGKADGHSINDAGTQVMSGLLGALLHPNPRRAAVVGLGTGSTAGWLASVPSIERVDVMELEPAILRVAKDCAPVNQSVLDNPKVKIELGDARESLITRTDRYDIIFSEPSNPYRAGISSLYTRELYTAASHRLETGGVFVQWIQAYEVDLWAVATAIQTMHEVFSDLTVWVTADYDLIVVARVDSTPIDVERMRARIGEEPWKTALAKVWDTQSVEGVLAHHVANGRIVNVLTEHNLGVVNTDDTNALEFAFARSVGTRVKAYEALVQLSHAEKIERPAIVGRVDWNRVDEEHAALEAMAGYPGPPAGEKRAPGAGALIDAVRATDANNFRRAARLLRNLGRGPANPREAILFATVAINTGDPDAPAAIARVNVPADRDILEARRLSTQGDRASAAKSLEAAFVKLRTDPWATGRLVNDALQLAEHLGLADPSLARQLFDAAEPPWAVESKFIARNILRVRLARAAHDTPKCIAAFQAFEPNVIWDRFLLETRVACYGAGGDPRAEAAAVDLKRFLDQSGQSFETDKPTPSKEEPIDEGPVVSVYAPDAAAASTDAAAAPAADAAVTVVAPDAATKASADAGAEASTGVDPTR